MSKAIQGIKNYYFPSSAMLPTRDTSKKEVTRNLRSYISPVQFSRVRVDIKSVRDAFSEAEHPYYPHRVRFQRIYQDTILNAQVAACMKRITDLMLLKDFKICNDKGEEVPELKLYFRNYTDSNEGNMMNAASWFDDFLRYTAESEWFGYSLISLGDLVNDSFPNLTIIPRQNVSPDRLVVSPFVYSLSGAEFLEEPYKNWHIWVPTSSDLGTSKCGYGLLSKVAVLEIFLRNNMGYNADFIEMNGQPIRVGTTSKTEEAERAEFEQMLANMGFSAYALLDDGADKLELIESKNVGTAWNIYDNFEERLEKKISKMFFGHSDAMDSVAGKLGNDSADSPGFRALMDTDTRFGNKLQAAVNSGLIPRMRKLGFPIPQDYHFEFLNDTEKEEFRRRVDNSNKVTADIAVSMKNAGLQMDAKYFEERTGIPTTPIVNTETPANNGQEQSL